MERRIGEVFDGVISGISNYLLLYVELPDTVEGMVHVSELDGDYYVFNEAHYELVGERTRKPFKAGTAHPRPGGGWGPVFKDHRLPSGAGVLGLWERKCTLRSQGFPSGRKNQTETRKTSMGKNSIKLIANNKKAYFDYFIDE